MSIRMVGPQYLGGLTQKYRNRHADVADRQAAQAGPAQMYIPGDFPVFGEIIPVRAGWATRDCASVERLPKGYDLVIKTGVLYFPSPGRPDAQSPGSAPLAGIAGKLGPQGCDGRAARRRA
jgi:hypothetical protein